MIDASEMSILLGQEPCVSQELAIRDIEPGDETVWRELWAAYLEFYEAALPESTTAVTWQRLFDPVVPFGAILAQRDGVVIGFANFVLHPFPWSERPACLLHDLFVRPDARGGGTGRALIQHLIARGARERWDRVYWLTKEDNAEARRLYDTFAPADGFIRYKVSLP